MRPVCIWRSVTGADHSGAVTVPRFDWSRRAEYTSDRGGLIACRNLGAAVSAMGKLAIGPTLFESMDIDALLRQRDDLGGDVVARLSEKFAGHPFVVNRVGALRTFSETAYFKSVAGDGGAAS